MYRPNFCANCGSRIVRLKWYLWTSRCFCDGCARTLLKQRLQKPLVVALFLLGLGFLVGRSGRPTPPPLLIERRVDSQLNQTATHGESNGEKPNLTQEVIYICGARTKKGSPCSRRVHGPVRCWQHKGMPAILAADKLVVKE